MKQIFVAALSTGLLILFSCEKSPISPKSVTSDKPVKPTTTVYSKSCDPYQNIEGYQNLFPALNEFAICDYLNCTGPSVVHFLQPQNNMLKDPSGNYYLFDSFDIITPSKQNEIMGQAAAWGTDWINANIPGSGYFVSAISYGSYVPGPLNISYVKITITLRKCTGTPGEGS